MADEKPGIHSSTGLHTSHPKASRHTMTMRKIRDEDARRVEQSDRLAEAENEDTRYVRPPRSVTRTSTGRTESTTRTSGKRVSGRTVVIRHEGEISHTTTRIDGQQTAVRVTGGDKIIRYQSGDMVIQRGSRRAQIRRQIIWVYALGYLFLFGLYFYFLLTGTTTVAPNEFVDRAFVKRRGEGIYELERAAYEVMRGNRTPAEIRLAESLSFYDENQDLIHIASGDRLTLLTAAKLGKAIIDDQKLAPSRRTLAKPLKIYKETYLANMHWPFWLSLYNAIGFFLIMILFLWRPIRDYLGTEGKKTAVALRNAREAQDATLELKDRYRSMIADFDARGGRLRWEVDQATEGESASELARAKKQASSIAVGIQGALESEARKTQGRLVADTAREACEQARTLLENRLGQKEHDLAIDELIADIQAVKPSQI